MSDTPGPVNPPISLKDRIAEILAEWQATAKKGWSAAVVFVVKSVDLLVNYAEQTDVPGTEKKSAVLVAISTLFDTIVIPLIPFPLRFFAKRLKNFFVYTVISVAVDWLVAKYNAIGWDKVNTEDVKKFTV